jgi:hypothetical protein
MHATEDSAAINIVRVLNQVLLHICQLPWTCPREQVTGISHQSCKAVLRVLFKPASDFIFCFQAPSFSFRHLHAVDD